MKAETKGGVSLTPVLEIGAAFGLLTVAVFVTYARLPAADLYAVSHEGLAGGGSRVLLLLGYPISLVAIATLGFVVDRVRACSGSPAFRRAVTALAAVALALCASVALPGVIDQNDLDARPVNAVAALGVVLAMGLAVAVARRAGPGSSRVWERPDRARVAAGLLLLFVAIPWIAADLGLSIGETPVLGRIFLGDELVSHAAEPELAPAVHRGHHHGMDGVMIALAAVVLLRALPDMRRSALRTATAVYVSLALVYGLANTVEDGWLEQLVKRGTVGEGLPSMLRPDASWAWAGIVVAAIAVSTIVIARLGGGDGSQSENGEIVFQRDDELGGGGRSAPADRLRLLAGQEALEPAPYLPGAGPRRLE